ncbi:uncharacterized protein GGS25DRAFT_45204 [Hypoxylon fragiforme]|uniref:uncharacterized protein n=1 Tax=Hypoxylon fragiforme TaxID=63214 RepID=UPI0020C6D6A8|nr:uncharacterized protein GGS25DRAFT_45204 [Hypoxylon fragiforme]KAI2614344.1 hypothetical protein GGS25DRAFT_45204 [Hypoxylon fragiforme]
MNNFGVIELASTKTTNAPGWAYVPDNTAPHLASAASSLQPGHRNKRAARNQAASSTSALYADADARQEAKLRREIEALDRDNYHRDIGSIPVVAGKGGSGKAAGKKHTANVRKILQSQKTFANHLADFEALLSQEKTTSTGLSATAAAAAASSSSSAAALEKQQQQQQKKHSKKKSQTRPSSRSASISKATPAVKQEEDDVEMLDADADATSTSTPHPHDPHTILTPSARPSPPSSSHPLDASPLLISRVPPLPTDAELRALLSAPPLSYTEARARWTADDKRYPARSFCEVCGYWGRVRCMKCGVRVCALDCLETHREECVTRYGL